MIPLGIEPATLRLVAQCLNQTLFFPLVTLGHDFGLWPPLTGLRDHTHWTHRTQ